MRIIITFLIVLVSIQPVCFAGFSKDYAGTSTAQFLKLGAGARAAGMGDAFTSVADDASAVYWNPAGLTRVKSTSITFMHSAWFEDVFYDWFSFARSLKSAGTIGAGVQYLSYGGIRETDENGIKKDEFKPNDIAATVSYARKIYGVSLGVNAKYVSSKIKKSATAYTSDIGVLYDNIRIADKQLRLGLVAMNIGGRMKFIDESDPLPLMIKTGCSYDFMQTNDHHVLLALDVFAPRDYKTGAGVAAEYGYTINDSMIINGRTGYNTLRSDIDGLTGITAGLGFSYQGLHVDYAWVPYGDLGQTHRVSLGYMF